MTSGDEDPIAKLQKEAQHHSRNSIYEEVRERHETVSKLQKEVIKDMRSSYKELVALDERYDLRRLVRRGESVPAVAHAAIEKLARTFKGDLNAYQNAEMMLAQTSEERNALNEKYKFLERHMTLPQKLAAIMQQLGNETLHTFLGLVEKFNKRLKQYGYPDVYSFDRRP